MFMYEMPTRLYFGKDCLKGAGKNLKQLGKKALIVTGRHSAKINGSQKAVTDALESEGVAWVLFDQIENNPSIDTVRRAADFGKSQHVDFVIGIGGGSPMDAAKIIALLCTNDLDDAALFTGPYVRPLPIVTVPTTSGTGSEVTKVGVLTNHHAGTKQSVNTPLIFPVLSYADPSFTESVSTTVTMDTAVDALSHAIEGYMSRKSTPMSDVWAEEAMRFLGPHLTDLEGNIPYVVREDLMYGATTAGMVIAQTGTTLVHGMGYQLTYYKGLSHGRANGLLLPGYMRLMTETMEDKVEKIWDILGFSGLQDFADCLHSLMPERVSLTEEEIEEYVRLTLPTGAVASTPYEVNGEVIARLYRELA